MVKAIVGANWGDEGKGKITDMLARDVGRRHPLSGRCERRSHHHQRLRHASRSTSSPPAPSTPTSPTSSATAWRLDVKKLVEELKSITDQGVPAPNLIISERAQLLMPYHVLQDSL